MYYLELLENFRLKCRINTLANLLIPKFMNSLPRISLQSFKTFKYDLTPEHFLSSFKMQEPVQNPEVITLFY